jgi:hypothetical protein
MVERNIILCRSSKQKTSLFRVAALFIADVAFSGVTFQSGEVMSLALA